MDEEANLEEITAAAAAIGEGVAVAVGVVAVVDVDNDNDYYVLNDGAWLFGQCLELVAGKRPIAQQQLVKGELGMHLGSGRPLVVFLCFS